MLYYMLMYYKKWKNFCMNCIAVFNAFLSNCSASFFGPVPNEVISMGFLVSLLKCD